MGYVEEEEKEGVLLPVEVDLDKRDVVATFTEKRRPLLGWSVMSIS